jgi:hypothetical protein
VYKYLFKHHHYIINNDTCINTPKLKALNDSIKYFNNFINPDPPIAKDSMLEFILTCFLINANVIALIVYVDEDTFLMFKGNNNSIYVNKK